MPKSKSLILRLTDEQHAILDLKSTLLGMDKSKLLRQSSLSYWNNDGEPFDAGAILLLYQRSDDAQKLVVVNMLFEYYRRIGYPHRKFSKAQLLHEMQKISRTKSPLLDNDHLQVNIVGTALANYYHPHMVKVRCLKNYRSPYEQYADDDLLKDAIKRWLDLGKKPNHSGIRRILRTRDGTRSVVNYKPAISLFLYRTYAHKDCRIFDMCMGYGGRLCGAIAANNNFLYHGIDVDSKTCIGNTRLAGFFYEMYDKCIESRRLWQFNFKMDMGCAEDIMPTLPDESYGLLFSSLPYFNIEQYSYNPNQSYLRYPEYGIWREKFLFVLIKESYRLCKKDGHLILNLKDYEKFPIASDACKYAENIGFKLEKTYQMRLSNNEFHRKEDQEKWHAEPVFVWAKS